MIADSLCSATTMSLNNTPFVGRLEAFNHLVPSAIDPILARTIGYYLTYPTATYLHYHSVQEQAEFVVKAPHNNCYTIEFFYSNGGRGYCSGSRFMHGYFCKECEDTTLLDTGLPCINARYIGGKMSEPCRKPSVQGLPFCPRCCAYMGIPLFKEKVEGRSVVKALGYLGPLRPRIEDIGLPFGCCIAIPNYAVGRGFKTKHCNKPVSPLSPFCKECLSKFTLSIRPCIMFSHMKDGKEVACGAPCWSGKIFCPACCVKNGDTIREDSIRTA